MSALILYLPQPRRSLRSAPLAALTYSTLLLHRAEHNTSIFPCAGLLLFADEFHCNRDRLKPLKRLPPLRLQEAVKP